MPEAITQEQVLKSANDAMLAIEPFKEFVKKNEQKLDALDIDVMKKMEKSILDAAETSQKFQATIDAEQKATATMKAGMEAEIKRLTDSGEANEKELTELKSASEIGVAEPFRMRFACQELICLAGRIDVLPVPKCGYGGVPGVR